MKYFWFSNDFGMSDDFNSKEECESDAIRECEVNPSEYGIYCYNSAEFPDGEVDIDDCSYLGFVA